LRLAGTHPKIIVRSVQGHRGSRNDSCF
jgi:hypothetical protein